MDRGVRPPEPRPGAWTGRYARTAAGWALLAAGAALLVLPGPGIPLVVGGLALHAREQAWARRTHRWLGARLPRPWGTPRAEDPRGDGPGQ
jgi:hypothetical protein